MPGLYIAFHATVSPLQPAKRWLMRPEGSNMTLATEPSASSSWKCRSSSCADNGRVCRHFIIEAIERACHGAVGLKFGSGLAEPTSSAAIEEGSRAGAAGFDHANISIHV